MEYDSNSECLTFDYISGDIYDSAVKNITETMVPITRSPKSSCKKCMGRGYIGRQVKPDTDIQYFIPCRPCIINNIDYNALAATQKRLKDSNELQLEV